MDTGECEVFVGDLVVGTTFMVGILFGVGINEFGKGRGAMIHWFREWEDGTNVFLGASYAPLFLIDSFSFSDLSKFSKVSSYRRFFWSDFFPYMWPGHRTWNW